MAKRIPRSFLAIALFVILPYLVGCGGGSSTPPPINDQLFVPNYVSSLEGLFHWNHLPMTVAVYLPTNWAQIYPSNQNLYIDAANEWNQPGMQPLVKVVPPGSPADATITFVKQSELGGNTLGRTECKVDSSNTLHSASIKIAIDLPSGGYASAADVQETIAHELGHALGIYGHSPYPEDLLYSTITLGKPQTVTIRDLNTIMTAYPSYFGRTLTLSEPSRSMPSTIRTVTIE